MCDSLIDQAKDVTLLAHMLSHYATVKVTKSKYNLQFLKRKLITEGILSYFSNKSAFDDKLKVNRPAGVGNCLICMRVSFFRQDGEFHWCVL